MRATVKTYGRAEFAASAARFLAEHLAGARRAVVTGGRTARAVYEVLARFEGIPNLEIAFSDERAVPPDDPASNYGMARDTLLDPLGLTNVHRIRGEGDPEEAARAYEGEIADLVEAGFDVVFLGLGADAHVAALFPGAPAVSERERLCVAVERPDGMRGVTLTAPALIAARRVIVAAAGPGKAEAVRRVLEGDEPPPRCPARLLAGAPSVALLLDEDAAARLS